MIKKYLSVLTAVSLSLISVSGINVRTANAINKEPVEIISERTKYSKSFDIGNETYIEHIDTVPIHYSDNGIWNDIDNSLIKNESGDYTNKANPMNVVLAEKTSVISIENVSDEQLVEIEMNDYKVSWCFVNSNEECVDDEKYSTIQINNNDDIVHTDDNLEEVIAKSMANLNSSAIYNSIYDDVDVKFDITPIAVKETLVLNNLENRPESFSYFIRTSGLEAKLYNENEVHFLNDKGEVFIIPAPFMFDSAESPKTNNNISVSLEKYNDGYIYTLYPDNEWLSNEQLVYPVMIDPAIMQSFNSTCYISEENGNFNSISNDYGNSNLLVGGSNGHRYKSYIAIPEEAVPNDPMKVITDATCNIYLQNTAQSSNTISINALTPSNSLNFALSSYCWNNVGNVSSTQLSTISVRPNEPRSFNIMPIVQFWMNYNLTNGNVGIKQYPLELKCSSNTVYYFNSNFAHIDRPFFRIEYQTNTLYTLKPTDNNYRYNNYPINYVSLNANLFNFQKKMNCYAYALQVYNRQATYNGYSLYPGEFGITYNTNLTNKTYNSLRSLYCSNGYRDFSNMSVRQSFIDKRIREDAIALGFSIVQSFRAEIENNTRKFVLPSSFDESSGRIIAMTTQHMTTGNTNLDIHFYLRNGNGTCSTHSGNCSIWTHKQGIYPVKNKSINTGDILCDRNIAEKVGEGGYDDNALYYIITKDTNIYNSWHDSNLGDTYGNTPYRSN